MTGSKRKRRSSEKIKGTEMSANKNRWTYTNGLGSLYVQCLVFFALVSMPVESSPCKVTTGKCNDGTGRKSILDKSECEDAAYSLGLSDVVATLTSNGQQTPMGCFWQSNGLYYAPSTHFHGNFADDYFACNYNSAYCLCLSCPAPVCPARCKLQSSCAPGTFFVTDGLCTDDSVCGDKDGTCKTCSIGTYQNEAGQTECKNCATGTTTGQQTCAPACNNACKTVDETCTVGQTHSTVTHSDCTAVTDCTNNGKGKSYLCQDCPAGTYGTHWGSAISEKTWPTDFHSQHLTRPLAEAACMQLAGCRGIATKYANHGSWGATGSWYTFSSGELVTYEKWNAYEFIPFVSCQNCASGKSSAAGSASCDLTTIKLPNGNGEYAPTDRVGFLGGIVDDIIGTDDAKKNAAIVKYGLIENWDVSEVTNFQLLFKSTGTAQSDRASFNGDISKWQTGKVTHMEERTLNVLILFFNLYILSELTSI